MRMNPDLGLHVVGLTGPTGAGKSVVARILEENGIPVVDADRLAREVVQPGSPCLAALAQAFGPAILRPDGSLDRGALAARAFASPEAAAKLNAITHPAIIARSLELLRGYAEKGCRAAAVDAPLLYESGMDAICAQVAVITAPAAVRRARIMARDGITADQAARRMAAQPDDAFYRARRPDWFILNDGPPAQLEEQARGMAARIRERAAEGSLCAPEGGSA